MFVTLRVMDVNMKMAGAFCLSLSLRVQLETALCFSSGLKLAFPAEAPVPGRLPAADLLSAGLFYASAST